MAQIEKMIAKTFMDIATGLETGSFGARPKIAVTGLGSEHGEANSVEAAVLAADRGVDVTLIGTAENEKFTTVKVSNEDEMYKEMEKMLDAGSIDGCVTMHYPFPIGVSTVGRVVTPGKGKQMFIANTTGTSAAERIEAMIRNTIAGIEVKDLEDAVQALWKAKIYAESGMGCTGPLVMMSEANHDKAVEILKAAGYIS